MNKLTPEQLRALADRETWRLTAYESEMRTALRAAADEVDRLRAESDQVYRDAYRLGREHSGAETYKQRVADLRAVIENAPHGWDCAQETYDGHDDSIACTCWKADVL